MFAKVLFIIEWAVMRIGLTLVALIMILMTTADDRDYRITFLAVLMAIGILYRFIIYLFYRCPHCQEKMYTTGSKLYYHLGNPWKGCPCCGRKLD